VKQVLPELIARGHVTRGQLGVMIEGMDAGVAKAMGMDRPRGALVENVASASPAERAGIRAGDVITSVDGASVTHASDLPRMVAMHTPGTRIELGVMHDQKTRDVAVTLDPMKEDEPQSTSATDSTRGELGLSMHDENGHAVVDGVSPEGPAAGKLKPGDVIEEVNHHRVSSAADAAAQLHTGDAALLLVKRGDEAHFVALER
jgi:serine protease Do